MTTPGDESRTELAWREIVENYGERPVLDDEPVDGSTDGPSDAGRRRAHPGPDAGPGARQAGPAGRRTPGPVDGPASRSGTDDGPDLTAHLDGQLPEDLVDDDPVEAREHAAAADGQFRPPTPPPLPRPRTWQRGLAWAGLFVAPLLALVLALLPVYVTALVWWSIIGWFVGGFVYLVREMPQAPRDPWDDGSRV